MQANKYFKVKELVSSRIYNQYGDDAIKFLDPKALEALENVREILGVPLICNNWAAGGSRNYSGYREPECSIGAKNSWHCFDQNTELLTSNGWKTVKTINEWDYVASLNTETDRIEFVKIDEIIKYHYKGNLLYIDNKHVQCAVTDEHRMYVRSVSRKYKRKTNKELTEKAKRYFDSLKNNNDKYHFELAKDIIHKRREFKCAGISNNINTYNVDILRMCMAVISDGMIYQKKDSNSINVTFNLKKERDKSELEDILSKLKWRYSKYYSYHHDVDGRKNVYHYHICATDAKEIKQIIGLDKKIPFWFLSLNSEILRQLVITYAKFDGSFDLRNNNSGITIFSKDKDNIDMLQSMCILSGMRCVKKTFKDYHIKIGQQESILPYFYHLYITQSIDHSRVNEVNSKWFYYTGLVWCVTNCNGTVISRRNGKVSIQGNCKGKAFDLVSTKLTAKEMREILENNQDKLKYPIRVEKWDNHGEISWLHIDISPNTHGQKLYFFKA